MDTCHPTPSPRFTVRPAHSTAAMRALGYPFEALGPDAESRDHHRIDAEVHQAAKLVALTTEIHGLTAEVHRSVRRPAS